MTTTETNASAQVRHLENFIGGRWVPSTGESSREVVSPVTGETVAVAPDASAGDVEEAVRAARRAQPGWAAQSAWERARICHRAADLIEARREELARLETLEQGKPYVAESLPDIDETAELFRIHAEDVKRLETAIVPLEDVNKRLLTFRRPLGVLGLISPWNFPFLIPVELIAPAIVTGNTVVIKPSEWTPTATAVLVEILAEAGVPEGVVNLVYGAGDVGERLVTSPVDGVGFIGSNKTAEKIVRAAGLKRTLIEASGNGPVVVCADADVRMAAAAAVRGGFFCAGQVCVATERVIVDRRIHDEFVEAALEEAKTWKLGDPFDSETRVGPMNNEPTAEKMDRHVSDAVEKGAKVLAGGSREAGMPTRLYYQPTVLDGITSDTLVHREETFGPIVPVMTAGSDEELLALANDSDLGLQMSVFTSSLKRAFEFGDRMRAGQVLVNEGCDWWEAHMPFGGAAGTKTGWGRVGGRHSLEDMTDLHTIVIDLGGLK